MSTIASGLAPHLDHRIAHSAGRGASGPARAALGAGILSCCVPIGMFGALALSALGWIGVAAPAPGAPHQAAPALLGAAAALVLLAVGAAQFLRHPAAAARG